MTIDLKNANLRHHHRRNIERYCRLLATPLTDLERQYLHRRIAEEHAELERLERSYEQPSGLKDEEPAVANLPPSARQEDLHYRFETTGQCLGGGLPNFR